VAFDTISLENGEKRKRLELHCDEWDDYPIYWVEGIGSTAGLASYAETCFADAGGVLLCMHKDGDLLYDNPDFSTCWLQILATDELEKHNISFYPNPVQDLLYITDPDSRISSISVFDTRGQLLSSGLQNEIETSNLLPGCYQLCVILKTGERIYDRFIKL
jgi:hypothetical protein